MKFLLILVVTVFVVSCVNKNPTSPLKTDKEKLSYVLGQQIGGNIKSQKIEVDVPAFAMAVNDALEGKKSISDAEMQEALQKFQNTQMEKMKAEGTKNKQMGEEFLAKNKTQEGVKTTDSGLQYKVIKAGPGKGPSPKKTDTVVAHYSGKLIDGSEFDSSYKRDKPIEIPVTGVIPGWTEALQLMKAGDKWQLFIPSQLAYGEQGRPGIPANSVLVFDIELISIKK